MAFFKDDAVARREWKDGWTLVLASALGMVALSSPSFSMGVFFAPLQAEFGWTKTQLSIASTILSVTLSTCAVFVGMAADRFGSRKLALSGLIVMSCAMAALSMLNESIFSYWIGWTVVAIGLALCTALVWTKAIVSRFAKSRGLALAITMTGSTIAGVVVPLIATPVILHHGWRTAYLVVGGFMFLVSFPMVFAFFYGAKERDQKNGAPPLMSSPASSQAPQVQKTVTEGLTVRQAVRKSAFWLSAVSFFLAGGAVSGILVHMVPLLLDRGLAPMRAAAAMSLLSVGAVVGRLGTGFFLDRVPTPRIAAVIFTLPVTACILLLTLPATLPVALAAAVGFGFAVGAELDLTAYITARYFGIGSYGTIYGLMGAIFAGGGASLPPLLGQMYEWEGSYHGSIILLGALFFASAAVLQFLRLPEAANAPIPH